MNRLNNQWRIHLWIAELIALLIPYLFTNPACVCDTVKLFFKDYPIIKQKKMTWREGWSLAAGHSDRKTRKRFQKKKKAVLKDGWSLIRVASYQGSFSPGVALPLCLHTYLGLNAVREVGMGKMLSLVGNHHVRVSPIQVSFLKQHQQHTCRGPLNSIHCLGWNFRTLSSAACCARTTCSSFCIYSYTEGQSDWQNWARLQPIQALSYKVLQVYVIILTLTYYDTWCIC